MRKFHYEIECEITPEVERLFTRVMLELYEKHKNDERIFPKEKKIDQ